MIRLIKSLFKLKQGSSLTEIVKSLLQLRIVRYLISAVTATTVDLSTYFLSLHFLFQKQNIVLSPHVTIAATTGALTISYSCGLITNFLFTRFFVFAESEVKPHHQFMRFALVAAVIFFLNYGLMNLLIKQFNWYPFFARAFSAVSIGFVSFITHKFFTFRVGGTKEADDIAS